jgi:hypothetical protein
MAVTKPIRTDTYEKPALYEEPALITLGSLHELTLCDKLLGTTDGHTFILQPIVCVSGV